MPPEQTQEHNTTDELDLSRHTLVLERRNESEPVSDERGEPYVAYAEVQGGFKETAVAVGAALVVTMLVVGSTFITFNETPIPPVHVAAKAPVVEPPAPPSAPNPYEALSLTARAAVVYDIRAQKVLYAHHADEVLPLASLTKLMTALVAAETAENGTRIAVDPSAIETEGDSGLLAHETWNLRKLISFTLLTSSNDGADAIAAAVGGLRESTPQAIPAYERTDAFVATMNSRAREIGLEHTTFNNPTGLDEGGREGGRGSAEDMARLLSYLWQHEPRTLEDTALAEVRYVSEDGFVHVGENTNSTVATIPGILGSKTGYTDLAGGNLGIVYDAGLHHPIAVVVLGSTREQRFDDVQALVDATYGYVENGWYAYEVAGSTPRDSSLTNS